MARTVTYDFRAFCRGQLIRTTEPCIIRWLTKTGTTMAYTQYPMFYPGFLPHWYYAESFARTLEMQAEEEHAHATATTAAEIVSPGVEMKQPLSSGFGD